MPPARAAAKPTTRLGGKFDTGNNALVLADDVRVPSRPSRCPLELRVDVDGRERTRKPRSSSCGGSHAAS